MFRYLFLLLFFTSFIFANLAKSEELTLKFQTPSKKSIEPGVTINAMITVENGSDSDKEIIIQYPQNSETNWRFISDYSSIRIEKKNSIRKIIGIQVPSNIKAGEYTIFLLIVDKSTMQSFGKIEIPVQVIPKYALSVGILKSPEYIYSGENISLDYLVQNRSNLDTKVKIRLINGTENRSEEFTLQKDSSIIKNYSYKTDKTLSSTIRNTIIIISKIENLPETERSTSTAVDIYPSLVPKYDKFNRFPVQISGIAALSNRSGQQLNGGMFEVFGSGILGKTEDQKLEFHMRGPNRSGDPLFGMNDEYYMKYNTPRVSLSLGHSNYGLSELTESSRSGLGAEAIVKFNKIDIGAYIAQPRYYPLIKNLASLFMDLNINPQNQLNIGYLTKIDTLKNRTNLFSLSSKNNFGKKINSDIEVAISQNKSEWNSAIKSSINLSLSKWNTHLVLLYAQPNFLGYVTNSMRMNVGSSILLKKTSISLNYDYNSTNMALDTFYTNLPYSNSINITINHRIVQNQSLSASIFYNKLKDRATTPLFNYIKTSGRISYQNKIKLINLSIMGDFGKMENLLLATNENSSLYYNGTMTVYFNLNKTFSTNVFASYQGGKQKNVTGNRQIYYGGALSANIKNSLSISAQYNSDFEWALYTMDRSLLSLNMLGKINKNNELLLQGNYNLKRNTLDQKEYNVQLKYVHTLNMPVSRKKNIGSLSGKILDHGVGKVNGVIVNVNGIQAITDKNGIFKIPVLPVGKYTVSVRTNLLGIYAITEQPGPLQIEVFDNKVSTIEIALTNSGKIAGQLEIQEDANVNKKNFIPVKGSIDRLIVEASNGKEVFRKYTNPDATFNFDDLRPGSWQVKIYPNGLPTGYSIINSIFTLEIKSGQIEPLKIIIQKKARKIQFQSTINKK